MYLQISFLNTYPFDREAVLDRESRGDQSVEFRCRLSSGIAGQSEKNVTLPDSPNNQERIFGLVKHLILLLSLNRYQVDSRIGTIGSLVNLIYCIHRVYNTVLVFSEKPKEKERKEEKKRKVHPYIPKV